MYIRKRRKYFAANLILIVSFKKNPIIVIFVKFVSLINDNREKYIGNKEKRLMFVSLFLYEENDLSNFCEKEQFIENKSN